MGKCVRIRGSSSKPPPAAAAEAEAASSCLTLRSGRRVPPVAAACGPPRTSGRPRRHRAGSALRRWCGAAEAADKQVQQRACGSPRRGSAAGRVLGLGLGARRQLCHDDGRTTEAEVPPSRAADIGVDDGRGDCFEPKTPLMTGDDCDAAVVKVKAKHENESRCRGLVAAQTPSPPPPPPPPPTEAEIEAFFAAAELAERRRFAEAYNYDVALDCPLEGRFEWTPVNT
ncbi:hypothetical protein BDA96_05G203500 [Sorghum bicolor]|uniref:Cyclin-dependent kinase inhibitor domain-containing protein n=2 Tax=Sorghum bicolor TaxID=4558 RepID=A0A921QYN3_SORBI|nr:cyclin-dependent kinase inhibitor 3-like [Sorghum bicolor]KAG0530633.1 hypothetical protein BDA96_05G203500 [Sorghum bicolor]OQU83837.1 hypothetical protein SORBI_3005G187000 [Sorghum bicolor]|eukprot:XP_021317374.1 cyclin-dependent kinase inhibitor 3-like [Sorghum bicolor]